MSMKRGVDFLKAIADFTAKNGGHDAITEAFKVTGGGDGHCIGEFKVAKNHLNAGGGLHGGYIATLVDNVTTYALMSQGAYPGVSVELRVRYLKGVREGEEIIAEAQTKKVGRQLAFIECLLKKKSDGTLVAKGEQTKYIEEPK